MPSPRRQWSPDETCSEPRCLNKRYRGSLLCAKHHRASRQTKPCSIDGCPRPLFARGWCQPHYYRWKRTGDARAVEALRDHSAYGTGRQVKDGYVRVSAHDHPDADSRGYALEHRLVMEQVLGRRLLPFETPHHRNGDRGDNRPANLELWASSQPKGQRAIDLLEWAEEIVALYGPERGLLAGADEAGIHSP